MLPRVVTIISITCALLHLTPPARSANSVGLNIHVGRETFIEACADLGVGWVRMDANWFALEPTRDTYNWTEMDAWVTRAHDAGLQVYLTLAYTPAWETRPYDTDGLSHNDVPASADEWVEFVSDAVNRYRNMGVTHFGIWNEPNLDGFFDGSVDQYVDTILVPGAAAVRSACTTWGDCQVLGPDLANVGEVDVYLQDIFARVPASTFDIIAHHIYQDFAETGWNILSGDSFINALEQQRCPIFCRKPLRDILDEAGYSGQVWITETGYRAIVDDAADEHLQAVYLTRVMEEQLGRSWYTNSFFYEILDCRPDQPDCSIDGYGLMRATNGQPNARSYPDDYRRKEAFWALKQFIADHPEIVGTEPPAACGDGVDNDGDGLTDLADRGCADAFDQNEADDPPRARITAYTTPGIAIDGDPFDFGPHGWVALDQAAWQGTEILGGDADLSLRAAVRWSPTGLFLAVEVTDDQHQNDHPAPELWLSDSLQLAFDEGQNGGAGYDLQDDHEINCGLSQGAALAYRHHGPAGADDAFETQIVRAGTATRYEIRLPPSTLPQTDFVAGTIIGFSFLVNDDDGSGRAGWMEWTPGIGTAKVPGYFGEIVFSAEVSGPGDPDGGVDAGPDGQDQDGFDASADGTEDGATDGAADAGEDAGIDAGADAGADGDDDGGALTDQTEDGGADGDEPAGGGDGCSCGANGAAPGSGWLLAGFLFWRRARRKDGPKA